MGAKTSRGERDMSGQHGWNHGRQPAGARGLTSRELHPWEKRRGARLLASVADDADDLRQLLAAAGLTAADGLAVASPPFITATSKDS
jgi:hypothetical protein